MDDFDAKYYLTPGIEVSLNKKKRWMLKQEFNAKTHGSSPRSMLGFMRLQMKIKT